jgi:F-type H+-transporting ATPase subunit gamma
MPTLKQIEEEIETVSTIKDIVQAYQKIANLRMNSIREKVLKNRKFFVELSAIYQRTKTAYLYSLKKGWLKKQELSFLQPKKDRIAIFLSANKAFYGPLILNILQEIQIFSEKNKFDLAITGKVGKTLVKQNDLNIKTFYFQLNDEKPKPERIKKIIEFVKNYKEIIVFHGKYETVLTQTTAISQISGGLPPATKMSETKTYLFEPSAEEILRFFEKEIIATLFNQTILEHQLARYASRIIAMYRATESAKESRKKLILNKNRLQRQNINKEQIELFGNLVSKI